MAMHKQISEKFSLYHAALAPGNNNVPSPMILTLRTYNDGLRSQNQTRASAGESCWTNSMD
jgi:hypothetical protein